MAGPPGNSPAAIGAAPAVSTYVLPLLLDRFVQDHPGVRLLVRTGHSEEIVDLVLRSEVQLGLVRELRADARAPVTRAAATLDRLGRTLDDLDRAVGIVAARKAAEPT